MHTTYNVHCCAHRLNLVVVDVCSSIQPVNLFFHHIQTMHNLIANSPKSKELLQSSHNANLNKLLEEGIIETGKGLHQEKSIGSLSVTRWSSHYKGLLNMTKLFDSICVVLDDIAQNSSDNNRKAKADMTFMKIKTTEFIFILKLMTKILELTFTLSQSLQRKQQCLSNASRLISLTIQNLKTFQETGFDKLLSETVLFCSQHDIEHTPLDELYTTRGRPRQNPMTTRSFFKSVYESATKLCIDELERRFSGDQNKLMNILLLYSIQKIILRI